MTNQYVHPLIKDIAIGDKIVVSMKVGNNWEYLKAQVTKVWKTKFEVNFPYAQDISEKQFSKTELFELKSKNSRPAQIEISNYSFSLMTWEEQEQHYIDLNNRKERERLERKTLEVITKQRVAKLSDTELRELITMFENL